MEARIFARTWRNSCRALRRATWFRAGGAEIRREAAASQARGYLNDGPAALRIAVQGVTRDIEKNCGQSIRHDGVLPGVAGGSGEMLRESFHESDAERPDVAGGRDDAFRDFRRIVRACMT